MQRYRLKSILGAARPPVPTSAAASRVRRAVLRACAVGVLGGLLGAGTASAEAAPDIWTRLPVLNVLTKVPMPRPLGMVLQRVGVDASDDTLLGNIHPGFRALPDPDSELAALMERARREDVVADSIHPMFGDPNIGLGVWQSSFFLENYGTALFLAAPYRDDRIPVFLVHGMKGSPRDFAPLVTQFADSRYQPISFFYPTGMALGDAARQLGMRLQEFVLRHHVQRFAVIGHSVGGLVAKGMLDQFDVTETLPGWGVFISISSPWRGIESAQNCRRLPRHPRSWEDMPPTSTFVRNINSTPFPGNLPFYLFFGDHGRRKLFVDDENDGVVSLQSVIDAPACKQARETFRFDEDHRSILASGLVYQNVQAVLERELPPDGIPGSPAIYTSRN